MKKIHTIAGAMLLSSFAFAQSSMLLQQTNKDSSEETVIKKKTNSNSTKKVAAGIVKQRCDVGFSILAFNAQADFMTGTTNTVNIGTYIAPVNVDSTVRYSLTSGTKYVKTHKQGVTFDPQSIIYDPNYLPLFANSDTYYLDTVWIGGIYAIHLLPQGEKGERERSDHPTDPSKLMPISFCVSAINSIGNCCSTSRTNPFTMSATASSCESPRDMQ